MAGKQVRTYLHPEDRCAVDSYIRTRLNSVLLTERWPSVSPCELANSRGPEIASFVCPRELLDELRPVHVEAMGYWVIRAMENPVIEWHYSVLRDGFLYPGRFYFNPHVKDSAGGRHLLNIASLLFVWVREFTVLENFDWGRERLGPEAAVRYQAGDISIIMNPFR